jgi:glycerol-3-phosphate dehydrogenase
VRPLIDDESGNPAAVTRDYRLELDAAAGAPLLSVWGGKITTFRKLAEEAAELLGPALADVTLGDHWTATAPLPGGDLRNFLGERAPPAADVGRTFELFVEALSARFAPVGAPLLRRLARRYGTRAVPILERGLGAEIAPGVFVGELAHLRAHEWARTGEDVLWRRTKLGLHLDGAGRAAVSAWMAAQEDDARVASDAG